MEVVTTYLPTLMLYALHLTGNEHDAKDLLQEVALKILKANIFDKPYDEQTKICYKSVYFCLVDMKRKQKVRFEQDMTGSIFFSEVDNVFAKFELADTINVLKSIYYKYRVALTAYAYGYSSKEISEATGENRNAVLSQLCYARRD